MLQKMKIISIVILAICFISISLLVRYNNQSLLGFDYYINIYFDSIQSPTLDSLVLSVTKVCNIPESIIIFIVFGMFLLLKNKKQSICILIVIAMAGTALPEIIKTLIKRIRPVSNLLLETDYSFPSGHATIATIFLLSSIFLMAPVIKNNFTRNIFLICTCVIFPLVIVSRIYLSVHWFSDILAGILLGSICYLLAIFGCCLKKKNML